MFAALALVPTWVWKWLGIAMLFIGAALYIDHEKAKYDNARREEGRQEVRAQYQARVAQQVLDYTTAVERADKAEKDRNDALQAKQVAEARAADIAHRNVVLSADLGRVLRDPVSADTTASAVQDQAVPAVPAAEVEVYDEHDIAQWRVAVEQAYDSAVEDATMCRERYDAMRNAQMRP